MPRPSQQSSFVRPTYSLQSNGRCNPIPESPAIESTACITSSLAALEVNPNANNKFNYTIVEEPKEGKVLTPVVSDMDSSISSEHGHGALSLPSITRSTSSFETLPAMARNTSRELFHFTKFPYLPVELRLKVWRYATDLSRLIEIEWSSNMCLPTSNVSAARPYRISRHSRQTPVLLHVNRESRRESLTIYTLRTFGPTPPIYFNYCSDILLFGERSCISTAHDVFKTHRHPIPNVAITINGFTDGCCDMDFVHAENEGIIMQTLYGSDTTAGRVNGCIGLKNVYFVVGSLLQRDSAREPYPPVALRPATSDGLTFDQVDFKRELKNVIQGAENGEGLELTGGDIWTGGDLPKFHFVSFAPPPMDGKVYDGMTVYCKWGKDVAITCSEAAIKEIEQKTGCVIEVAPVYHLPGMYSGVSEIGISGVVEKVEETKELVWAECLHLGWASRSEEAGVGMIWVQAEDFEVNQLTFQGDRLEERLEY